MAVNNYFINSHNLKKLVLLAFDNEIIRSHNFTQGRKHRIK